ncbi:MAG: arsenate reductase ArsC [Nitrospinae bacterium]|nr:arsenate reductase ArsC [Nitrospinota bacterium]
MMSKILILCTGNSCRSQMAEGFLKSIAPDLEIYSAGTHPAKEVHPKAVRVMKEAGVNISGHFPKTVDQFQDQNFAYVITVCDSAKETCPVFSGKVRSKLHFPFTDPAIATGTAEEVLAEFRRVRDEIKDRFLRFYNETLMSLRLTKKNENTHTKTQRTQSF